METSGLMEMGEHLAGEVRSQLEGGRSKKWRCLHDLKSRIVSYARECRDHGETVGDISSRIGLIESTLGRWLRVERAALNAGFRAVAIVRSEAGGEASAAQDLCLITPHGYRVEGLDAQTLAFLLRVVG